MVHCKNLFFYLLLCSIFSIISMNTPEDILKKNNTLASALLIQKEFIQEIEKYIKTDEDLTQVNDALASLVTQDLGSKYAIVFKLHSPEAIALAMRNKKLMETDNTSFDMALINEWKMSLNPEIKAIGDILNTKAMIAIQAKKHSIHQERVHTFYVELQKSGILNTICDYQELSYLCQGWAQYDRWLKDLMQQRQRGLLEEVTTAADILFIAQWKRTLQSYRLNEQEINKFYQKIIETIKSLIAQQPRNKQKNFLKYLYNDYDKAWKEKFPDILMVQEIPLESASKKPEKSDDFISDILKNQQTRKKIPAKKASPKKKNIYSTATVTNANLPPTPFLAPVVQSSKPTTNVYPVSPIDGSSVILETPDLIKITSTNGLIAYIFKTDSTNTIPLPLNYTNNVLQWFENPDQALQEQGYMHVGNKKLTDPADYNLTIHKHAFPAVIDLFIKKYGIQKTVQSRINPSQNDSMIMIPGALQEKNKVLETGLFVYFINSLTGKCYHRLFTLVKSEQLISTYHEKGTFDVDFPSLQLTHQ